MFGSSTVMAAALCGLASGQPAGAMQVLVMSDLHFDPMLTAAAACSAGATAILA
jgi:hypothetical protein